MKGGRGSSVGTDNSGSSVDSKIVGLNISTNHSVAIRKMILLFKIIMTSLPGKTVSKENESSGVPHGRKKKMVLKLFRELNLMWSGRTLYTYTHIHTCIHTHTHMYIHTYTQVLSLSHG